MTDSFTATFTAIFDAIEALDDDFGYWIWTTKVMEPTALGEALGSLALPVPADYVAFVRAHGCAAVQAKDTVWARPQAYAVGPLWAHAYGFEIYGIATDTPPPLDVRLRRAKLASAGITDLVPVAGLMGRGDLLCVDARGALCWLNRGEREPVAGTFTSVIEGLVQQLAVDKERAKAAGAQLWS